ncbi:MAG: DNA-3-methyladenine glycosylase [bacterium]|nr:DNA-3-methyladenine glycosylase [bacterium]
MLNKINGLTRDELKLINLDSDLAELIKSHGSIVHETRKDYYVSLARSIIGQQISVKAAAKIFERFKRVTKLSPVLAQNLSEAEIKEIGLSGQKVRYIRDLSEHFVKDSAVFNHLDGHSDDDVVSELTKIKGVGLWTAQMFMMFTLGRPDVFAPDDRGLQLAVKKLYGLPEVPNRSELIFISQKWKPYRTAASYHLWRSLDNTSK